jgi:hypothetical protein
MADRRAEEDEAHRQTAIALGTLVAGYGAHRAALAAEASGYGALRLLGQGGRLALRALGTIGMLAMLYDPNTPSRNQFRNALGSYVRSEMQLMRDELAGLNLTGGAHGFVRHFIHRFDNNHNFGSFLTELQTSDNRLNSLASTGDPQAQQALEIMHRHIGRIVPNLLNIGRDNPVSMENPPPRTAADLVDIVRPMLWNPDAIASTSSPEKPHTPQGPSLAP